MNILKYKPFRMMSSSYDPIHPTSDSRVTHEYANLNNRRFHYVIGNPTSGREPRATAMLIHGWPDLWYGWRHTIPALLDLDLRVVAIDCLGYGGTDAPRCPPEDLSAYAMKVTIDAIAELLTKLNVEKAVIIGHDWGAMTAWRFVNFYPERTSHLATICVPYVPPAPQHVPIEELVKVLPNFTYQVALANPQTARDLEDKSALRGFLTAIHRGVQDASQQKDGKSFGQLFNVSENIVSNVQGFTRSSMLTEEEMDYYVEQYYAKGPDGPLNWYRTREYNWNDERQIKDVEIHVPTLFIAAEKDGALPPAMAKGQEKFVKELTYREVKDASHWVMTEKKEEVNGIFKEWFEGVVFGGKSKL